MPKINVYVSDELAEAVREAGIPVSAVCQRALEQAVSRISAIRETVFGDSAGIRAELDNPTERFSRFTNRARTMIALAMDDAAGDGVPVATEHLLAAILAEGNGLALSVLASMEIDPQELASALASRRSGAPGGAGAGETTFGDSAQEALRLTVTEAAGFGHNYVGSEHLLLGLIGEPNGLAGQVLRGAGAELRLTRRAVAGALAGYKYLQATSAAKSGTSAESFAMLTAAIQHQLEPVVARLDRLENR